MEKKIIDIRNNKMVGGDNVSDVEEIFLKQCNDLIESHLPNLPKEYKGFVEHGDNVYAMFETTSKKEIEFVRGSRFCLVDEIQKRKIVDVSIRDDISKMFDENPELLILKDKDGKNIKIPIVAYLCRKTDKYYENVPIPDEKIEQEETDQKIQHEVFGSVYLFTTDIITTLGSFFSFFTGGKKIKHYALFIEDERVIKNDASNVLDFIQQGADSVTSYKTYTCISFKDKDHEFWAVKSKLLFTEL